MSDPNAKPTAKQYADAQDPFRQTLQEYLPDVIIAWGNGAYDHTPNDGGVMIHPVEYDGAKAPGWRYLQYGKPIDLFKIHHPSRCFSAAKWHEVFWRIIASEYTTA